MLTLQSVWVLTPQYSDGDTILSKEHRLSDEMLIVSIDFIQQFVSSVSA